MRKYILYLTVLSLCVVQQLGAITYDQSDRDRQKILNSYREYILKTIPRTDPGELLRTMTDEGKWRDLNYEDVNTSDWKITLHLKNIEQLSLAWSDPHCGYYRDKELLDRIFAALDVWLINRYSNSNWWHNQIGVPRYMRNIIILLDDTLEGERRKGALEVMGQLRVLKQGEGANLIWSADLGFHHGLLTGDLDLTDRCYDLIINEIKVSEEGDGIKPDNSFHQHGPRLQMYQYGAAYFEESVRLAWQASDTKWEFLAEKVDILLDFMLEGWQWMARGINTVPGTMDRSVSRIDELRRADLRYLIPFICELDEKRAAELLKMSDIQNGKGNLEGFRHYPYSDFTLYHHNDFSFFLKTISSRTLATENINSENLKGHLLGSGDAYIIKNGKEYFNLMPVWDWEKLPGITNFNGSDRIDRSFVASAGDDRGGFTAMDYRLTDKEGAKMISAKKLWAFYQGKVVCMIAGLHAAGEVGDIFTVLDQSRLQGDVYVDKISDPIGKGVHSLNDVNWIYHNNIIYNFYTPADIELSVKEQTGSWYSINKGQPEGTVSENVFCPVIKHDSSDPAASAIYIISGCKSVDDIPAARAELKGIKVLRNDDKCQAMSFDDLTMISFYEAGSITLNNEVISVDVPCAMMISAVNETSEMTLSKKFNFSEIQPDGIPRGGKNADAVLGQCVNLGQKSGRFFSRE